MRDDDEYLRNIADQMENITTSIIICTYNRPQLLRSALQSVTNVDFDPDQFEIVVVDNGSNDQSRDVFTEISGQRRCHMSYTREERLGLSYARNKGIELAQGEIVVFLDDDEIVPANWLAELIKPYADDERIACIGGRIIPVFPNDVYPPWYSREIQGFFGGVDHGDLLHEVNFPYEYLGGGNISFDKELICKLGMFNVNLGVTGKTLYSGEENELTERIKNAGFKVLFNPNAVTYHLIERYRISRRLLYRRAFQNGISDAMTDRLRQGSSLSLLRIYSIILMKSTASYIINTLKSKAALTRASLAISRSVGKMYGWMKYTIMYRDPPK